MIRLLIVLVIIALSLKMLSGMLYKEKEVTAPEDTMIGAAYEPYTKAQQFSEEDYEKALDEKLERLEEKIDQ